MSFTALFMTAINSNNASDTFSAIRTALMLGEMSDRTVADFMTDSKTRERIFRSILRLSQRASTIERLETSLALAYRMARSLAVSVTVLCNSLLMTAIAVSESTTSVDFDKGAVPISPSETSSLFEDLTPSKSLLSRDTI
jgi:hypothetical protein